MFMKTEGGERRRRRGRRFEEASTEQFSGTDHISWDLPIVGSHPTIGVDCEGGGGLCPLCKFPQGAVILISFVG